VTPTATTSTYFFQGVNLKKLLSIALAMGLAAAVVNTLADINASRTESYDWLEFLQNLSLYASCSLLGLIFVEKTSLEVFLLRRRVSWGQKGFMLFSFGLLPGALVGITYHHLFFQYRFTSRVPLRVRAIHSHYDSLILSLRAGVTEELVFRLLLMTAFFYILRRVFLPLALQVQRDPFNVAVVVVGNVPDFEARGFDLLLDSREILVGPTAFAGLDIEVVHTHLLDPGEVGVVDIFIHLHGELDAGGKGFEGSVRGGRGGHGSRGDGCLCEMSARGVAHDCFTPCSTDDTATV